MFISNSVLKVCARRLSDGQININFEIVRRDSLNLWCDIVGDEFHSKFKKMALKNSPATFNVSFSDPKDFFFLTKTRIMIVVNDDTGHATKDTWQYKLVIKKGSSNLEAQAVFQQEEMLELLKEIDIK